MVIGWAGQLFSEAGEVDLCSRRVPLCLGEGDPVPPCPCPHRCFHKEPSLTPPTAQWRAWGSHAQTALCAPSTLLHSPFPSQKEILDLKSEQEHFVECLSVSHILCKWKEWVDSMKQLSVVVQAACSNVWYFAGHYFWRKPVSMETSAEGSAIICKDVTWDWLLSPTR